MPRNANEFDGTRYIVPSLQPKIGHCNCFGAAGRCMNVVLIFSAVSAVALSGATITGAKVGGPPVKKPPYTVSVTPPVVEHIPSDSSILYDDLGILRSEYDANTEWLFSPFGSDAPGTFNVLQYNPWIVGDRGGGNFSALYDDGSGTVRTDYSWVSIERYHNWGPERSGSGERVDNKSSNMPFYANYIPSKLPNLTTSKGKAGSGEVWLNKTDYPEQKIQNPTGGGKVPPGDLIFSDQPFCPLSCADADRHAYAYFDTFLVQFTWNGLFGKQAGGQVDLLDGMRWGVEITKDPDLPIDPGKTPEPSTAMIMSVGLAFLVVGTLRRRTRSAS